jgi:alkanesulfonate monooxygenase SsuD/methylene tetrahydromethanopterin reductase-like flavin-dependent oxidoreductase (luciferase family)
VIGTVEQVKAGLQAFKARTGVDELIITSSIYDHQARKKSLALTKQAWDELGWAAGSVPSSAA